MSSPSPDPTDPTSSADPAADTPADTPSAGAGGDGNDGGASDARHYPPRDAIDKADTDHGMRHSGRLPEAQAGGEGVASPQDQARALREAGARKRTAAALAASGVKPGDEPKKKKPPLTVLDFGRQRGFNFGVFLLAEIALLVLFRTVSRERFHWPEGVTANALIIIPFLQGLAAIALGRFSPRNVRGVLLIIIAIAPMLYAAVNTAGFAEVYGVGLNTHGVEYDGLAMHFPITPVAPDDAARMAEAARAATDDPLAVPQPVDVPQVDGLSLVPVWALLMAFIFPGIAVARLRAYFPRRKLFRVANLVGVFSIAAGFGLVALLAEVGQVPAPSPAKFPPIAANTEPDPRPDGDEDIEDDRSILDPDEDEDGIADAEPASANADDANEPRGRVFGFDEDEGGPAAGVPGEMLGASDVFSRLLRFPAIVIVIGIVLLALMHIADLLFGGDRRGIARQIIRTAGALGLMLVVFWMIDACALYEDTTWLAEQQAFTDAALDKGYMRIVLHGVLMFTLLFTSLALAAAGVVDTVITHVVKPKGPARLEDGRTWEEVQAIAKAEAKAKEEADAAKAEALAAALPDPNQHAVATKPEPPASDSPQPPAGASESESPPAP